MTHSSEALSQLVQVNLRQYGYVSPAKFEYTRLASGDEAIFVNFTDASYSTQDLACFIVAKEIGNSSSLLKKWSNYIIGRPQPTPFIFSVLIEGGASPVAAVEKLKADLIAIITTKFQSDVEVLVTAPATMPALAGLNGAVADANVPASGLFISVSGNKLSSGV